MRLLLGDRVTGVAAQKATVRVTAFATAEEFRDFFKTNYGPTVVAYRGSPTSPTGWPRSTPSWPRSPGGSTSAAVRWSGSTCCSRRDELGVSAR